MVSTASSPRTEIYENCWSVEGNKNFETLKGLLLRPCLQGGRVTPAGGLTLAGGQKIARVYMQNSTGRKPYNPGLLNARLHAKGPETIRKLIRNNTQTAVTNMTRNRMLENKII